MREDHSGGGSSHDHSSRSGGIKKSASADNFRAVGSHNSSRSNVIMSNETIAKSQNMGSRPLEEMDLEDIIDESRNNRIVKSKSMGASLSDMA
jgi:hypothetical protein